MLTRVVRMLGHNNCMTSVAKKTAKTAEGESEELKGEFVSFPDSPYELYQPYPPAGDQPMAINELLEGVEGVQDGEVYQMLFGMKRLPATEPQAAGGV